jgi:hypothetical protein
MVESPVRFNVKRGPRIESKKYAIYQPSCEEEKCAVGLSFFIGYSSCWIGLCPGEQNKSDPFDAFYFYLLFECPSFDRPGWLWHNICILPGLLAPYRSGYTRNKEIENENRCPVTG